MKAYLLKYRGYLKYLRWLLVLRYLFRRWLFRMGSLLALLTIFVVELGGWMPRWMMWVMGHGWVAFAALPTRTQVEAVLGIACVVLIIRFVKRWWLHLLLMTGVVLMAPWLSLGWKL